MGAYPTITLSSQAASPFQLVSRPPSVYAQSAGQNVFNLTCIATLLDVFTSLTYSMQVTADPIPSDGGNWVDHDVLTGLLISKISNVDYPITAYRLNVTSYTSGSVSLGACFWSGTGPYVGSGGVG